MREHVPASKIVEIAHGFDLNAFSHPDKSQVNHLKSKYNPENKFPVIGVISRWIELKGVQYIIPAFEKVLKQHPNALLLLFNANGNYTPALDLMFAKLPTSSAKKISFENDIVSLYQIFDVFVHVPVDKEIEAFGQTYIESLAAGVPSVFTLSGIANEVIRHEHNALVVPYRNADVIYEAIVRILGSAGLREKLVKSGKETASDFSISVQIDKLYRLYAF
jgi:glycosyltransferase involved in cell wall biosynthesis